MHTEEFMKLAIKEAEKSKKEGGYPFGSVITIGNKVIAKGRSKDHILNDVTSHAEINALRKASKKLGLDLSKCIIFCTSEPCNMCASAIFQSKIRKIVIGCTRKELSHFHRQRKIELKHLIKDAGYEVSLITGVLKKQNLELFNGVAR